MMLYALACRLARLLVSVFYRRVEVAGVEHVPTHGPLLIVANHHNALVDPLLILAAISRRIVPIAKAPLFTHPVMGPLLRAVGAIPVERRLDAAASGDATDPHRNARMFARAIERLRAGGAILIFPEGVSQAEPVLMPLRTGAARILLGAIKSSPRGEAPGAPALVPVGLVYDDPATFRGGQALVLMGRPIDTADIVANASEAPEVAVRELTERIADALRGLILQARDREALDLLRVAEALAQSEGLLAALDPAARAGWRRRALRALSAGNGVEEDGGERLRRELRQHVGELAQAGLTGSELEAAYPVRAAVRYVQREGAALALGLPAALWGMATHALPYRLTSVAARALRPEADVAATYKLAAGLALYPLCWLGEAWLAWRIGGLWLLGAFCVALVPAGLIALTWQERLVRFRRQALGFLHFVIDRNRHGHLVARRRVIVRDLEAAVAKVPLPERPQEPHP